MFSLANLVGGLAVMAVLCSCDVPLGIACIAGMSFFIGQSVGDVAREIRKLREK